MSAETANTPTTVGNRGKTTEYSTTIVFQMDSIWVSLPSTKKILQEMDANLFSSGKTTPLWTLSDIMMREHCINKGETEMDPCRIARNGGPSDRGMLGSNEFFELDCFKECADGGTPEREGGIHIDPSQASASDSKHIRDINRPPPWPPPDPPWPLAVPPWPDSGSGCDMVSPTAGGDTNDELIIDISSTIDWDMGTSQHVEERGNWINWTVSLLKHASSRGSTIQGGNTRFRDTTLLGLVNTTVSRGRSLGYDRCSAESSSAERKRKRDGLTPIPPWPPPPAPTGGTRTQHPPWRSDLFANDSVQVSSMLCLRDISAGSRNALHILQHGRSLSTKANDGVDTSIVDDAFLPGGLISACAALRWIIQKLEVVSPSFRQRHSPPQISLPPPLRPPQQRNPPPQYSNLPPSLHFSDMSPIVTTPKGPARNSNSTGGSNTTMSKRKGLQSQAGKEGEVSMSVDNEDDTGKLVTPRKEGTAGDKKSGDDDSKMEGDDDHSAETNVSAGDGKETEKAQPGKPRGLEAYFARKEGPRSKDGSGDSGGSGASSRGSQQTEEQRRKTDFDKTTYMFIHAPKNPGKCDLEAATDALLEVLKVCDAKNLTIGISPREDTSLPPLTRSNFSAHEEDAPFSHAEFNFGSDITAHLVPKKNKKNEEVHGVIQVGYNGGLFPAKGKWKSILVRLAKKGILLQPKTYPSFKSDNDMYLFYGIPGTPDYITWALNETLPKAIADTYGQSSNSVSFGALPTVKEVIGSIEWPRHLWDNNIQLLNSESKRMIAIEYDAADKDIIIKCLPAWKKHIRMFLGIYSYFGIVPDLKDPNIPSSTKTKYKNTCNATAFQVDATVPPPLSGLRPKGLEASFEIEPSDGQGEVVTTTFRQLLLQQRLPGRRPIFVAILESPFGVDAVVPNGEEYRAAASNISECPAAWLMYYLADDRNASRPCIEKALGLVFEPEAIRVANNCTTYDPATKLIELDMGDDTFDRTDEVVANLDWMIAAAEQRDTAIHSSNGRKNGVLFDFDTFEDEGSVDTAAYMRKRYPHDNLDDEESTGTSSKVKGLDGLLSQKSAISNSQPGDSQSLGDKNMTPPAKAAVVGSEV